MYLSEIVPNLFFILSLLTFDPNNYYSSPPHPSLSLSLDPPLSLSLSLTSLPLPPLQLSLSLSLILILCQKFQIHGL